jgi:flagellar protein FlbT
MSGLVITLAPNEAFLVNGVRLQNGNKPSRIRVCDQDARVLRCSDAMKPGDADTPVKQIYYAVQLIITGDIKESETVPALRRACDDVADALNKVDSAIGENLQSLISRRNFYSLLCYVKQMIEVEAQILNFILKTDAITRVKSAA